ncbi:hypothetical protein PC129_g3734 [Phytophthora cactorum]|uniref:HTH CENPB-type domain-containing protein n=2 Tax=Phytophthora cactorum TaxID=29920 RepID=A0A329SS91_9STRA|nr:hypothetical protein Pcac1_g19859 [Phytophthora cactorum]KAG2916358.1 hypothetical protein PC114_g7522 [Phytophthora cactorum]KAG2946590.1 hypothetical protein PC117_g7501 [Phytophthora cactorum]KAG3034262.1 hypothetical protein PC119_g4941 [Phytophthora cactorum]KAG3178245.1 hypothetical protein C6341_g8087 [Phytophthora cactorum]
MVARRECYEKEDVEEALDRTYEGVTFAAVARSSSILLRTLFKKSKELQATGIVVENRRGPAPAFSPEQEAHLVAWVAACSGLDSQLARQGSSSAQTRCTRSCMALQPGPERCLDCWYGRFIRRHPILSTRTVQNIVRVRSTVDEVSVRALFHAITKRVVELRLSACRVFNMDETVFMPNGTSTKVLAIWRKETRPNFHLTVEAAVSAAGDTILPHIIVPGKRIYKSDKAALSIEGDRVTGAPKGFGNGGIFRL